MLNEVPKAMNINHNEHNVPKFREHSGHKESYEYWVMNYECLMLNEVLIQH